MGTEKSAHHGWDEPVLPSSNLDTELKALWGQIDAETLISGTKSSRPSAGTADRIYFAYDEPAFYRDNGTGWEDVTPGGGGGLEKSLSIPHTNYDAGLSNEEIWRISLDTDESLEVHRLETKFKGGGTNTSFTVEIFDTTNGTSLASTSDRTTGNPVASSSSGVTILVRLTNSTGNSQVASINADMKVV